VNESEAVTECSLLWLGEMDSVPEELPYRDHELVRVSHVMDNSGDSVPE